MLQNRANTQFWSISRFNSFCINTTTFSRQNYDDSAAYVYKNSVKVLKIKIRNRWETKSIIFGVCFEIQKSIQVKNNNLLKKSVRRRRNKYGLSSSILTFIKKKDAIKSSAVTLFICLWKSQVEVNGLFMFFVVN